MFKSNVFSKITLVIVFSCTCLNLFSQINKADFKEPRVDFMNLDSTSKGTLYVDITKNPEDLIKKTSFKVCQVLYRNVEEIPNVEMVKYTVSDYNGISAKGGIPPVINISFSSGYLEKKFNVTNRDTLQLLNEIVGVLSHELTHAYQWDDGDRYSEIGGVIEGIADAVRTLLGYKDYNSKKPGGSYKDAYSTSAFFFVWIERNIRKDFIYKLNQSMLPDDGVKWTWKQVEIITGTPVEKLWEQYQNEMHLDLI